MGGGNDEEEENNEWSKGNYDVCIHLLLFCTSTEWNEMNAKHINHSITFCWSAKTAFLFLYIWIVLIQTHNNFIIFLPRLYNFKLRDYLLYRFFYVSACLCRDHVVFYVISLAPSSFILTQPILRSISLIHQQTNLAVIAHLFPNVPEPNIIYFHEWEMIGCIWY